MSHRVLRPGRVLDAAGRPIAGAVVSVVWGTAPTPEIARRTDAAGYFHVGLPPGRFRVAAVAPTGDGGSVEVDGAAEEEIVIRIAPPHGPA